MKVHEQRSFFSTVGDAVEVEQRLKIAPPKRLDLVGEVASLTSDAQAIHESGEVTRAIKPDDNPVLSHPCTDIGFESIRHRSAE